MTSTDDYGTVNSSSAIDRETCLGSRWGSSALLWPSRAPAELRRHQHPDFVPDAPATSGRHQPGGSTCLRPCRVDRHASSIDGLKSDASTQGRVALAALQRPQLGAGIGRDIDRRAIARAIRCDLENEFGFDAPAVSERHQPCLWAEMAMWLGPRAPKALCSKEVWSQIPGYLYAYFFLTYGKTYINV
jgi:hypothetical protein